MTQIKSKSRKLNRQWLHDHLNDPYVKLAQKEGFRARAAYKLKEIDEALRLVRGGQLIVDLGAAPGAWSQYVRRRLAQQGAAGTVIALDLLDIEPIDGVTFLRGDFHDEATLAALQGLLAGRAVDLVLSDLAPNLSGIAEADAARMADLVELAIEFSLRHLKPGGALVCKVFHGSGHSQLVELFKRTFRVVKPIKPKASRAKSESTTSTGRPATCASSVASTSASRKSPSMKSTQTPISSRMGPQEARMLSRNEGSSRGFTSNLTLLLMRSPIRPRSR